MKRSLRSLRAFFSLLTLVSLIVGMLVIAFWSDSQFNSRRVIRYGDSLTPMLTSDSGKIVLAIDRNRTRIRPPLWRVESGPARIWGGAHLNSDWYGHFGFGHVKVVLTANDSQTQTWIPYWSLAALTAILPLAWILHRFRKMLASRRARLIGLCPRCRYDLRASPDRCPECGFEKSLPSIAP